jgi:uncharacterized protein YukE
VPFEGMDADQLRGLAAQINTDAQTLSGLVTTMTGVVAELTLFWQGPMVAVFEQDWQAKHRPSLLAAHDTLTGLHTHLVSNIDQQASASAAEGGWTAERIVGDAENFITAAGLVDMTKLLHGVPVVGGALTGLGYVGTAVGVYQTGHEMVDSYEELSQGHYVAAANDYTIGAADGLETVGGAVFDKDPVLGGALILGGVDLKLADQVANLDWKDTPNPLSVSQFKQYYLPEIESMGTGAYWVQAGKTIFGDL